jgi:GDP-L-fucose synthase
MTERIDQEARIFVAGHRGLVGSALVRRLRADGHANLLLADRSELDLRDQNAVDAFFAHNRPDLVFVAAAKVGGIVANRDFPADFIGDNLRLQTNCIHSAWKHGARKLLFLGSSCIYPRDSAQPIREESLLTGPLEPTNEWYAIAKIAGIKLCQAYRIQHGFDAICAMPTNLYGPGDNFHPEYSHVVPALMRRFHEAKLGGADEVTVWGSGTPLRELLHVDDLASALVFLMAGYSSDRFLNIGSGSEVSIADLSRRIALAVGYEGNIVFDGSKPDGTPRKLLESSRIKALGWDAKIGLDEGLRQTYRWLLDNPAALLAGP